MLHKEQKSLDVEIRDTLEQLYPGISRLAPYMAQKTGFPEHAGEDAMHNAIVLFLKREDAQQWQVDFLQASPREQINYFLTAICNNGLKAMLRNRLEPLPEQGCKDQTAPDLAEEVEREDAITKAVQSLPERQKEVMEFAKEGYSVAEIAQILETSPGNVRQQMFKARKNIQKSQQGEGVKP